MKRIIIMGIPHHGNIGDNAIAVAEEEIIKKYFYNYELYEVPEDTLFKCVKKVKKVINKEDIILLHGGGNIGDTYEIPEKGRREVIKEFPDNKLIIFPQTSYFSDTEYGKKELEISKDIYNSHNNLVILARERKSYDFMKKNFYNAKVYLTPDIVMTLKKQSSLNRNGALLLFRNDKEKEITNEIMENIIKELDIYNYKYTLSDMNEGKEILKNVAGKHRENLINNKFKEIQNAEIVITDRLHGMIFSAITETPCIVFSNFNHKIVESFEWLKDLGYIKYCNNYNRIGNLIAELKNIKDRNYNNAFALDIIVNILKKEIC